MDTARTHYPTPQNTSKLRLHLKLGVKHLQQLPHTSNMISSTSCKAGPFVNILVYVHLSSALSFEVTSNPTISTLVVLRYVEQLFNVLILSKANRIIT